MNDRWKIETLLLSHPGLLTEEIEKLLGLRNQTASARISEMLQAGVLVWHGKRRTSSGCLGRVYYVAGSVRGLFDQGGVCADS